MTPNALSPARPRRLGAEARGRVAASLAQGRLRASPNTAPLRHGSGGHLGVVGDQVPPATLLLGKEVSFDAASPLPAL